MEAPVHVAWTSLRKGPKPTGKWSAHNGSMTFHLRRGESRDVRPRLPHRDVSWIGEHRRPFRDYSVGSLVPVVFEAYARILHPAWGPSVTGKDRPVRWDAVAAWSGRTMHALALEVGWQPVSGRFEVEPPTLIWPADQAWFVAADPDLDSTYLGGSAALVDAVIAHADLEAWQAAASDEIGVASDSVNL